MDVHVTHNNNIMRRNSYEVFLVILFDDYEEKIRKSSNQGVSEYRNVLEEYIKDLAKYMGIYISGIYLEVVTEEEWEEMKKKSDQTNKYGPIFDL